MKSNKSPCPLKIIEKSMAVERSEHCEDDVEVGNRSMNQRGNWSLLNGVLLAALIIFATAAMALSVGCGGSGDTSSLQSVGQDVSAWAYQLQNIDPVSVAGNSTFDLVVIDYSSDGAATGKWTSEQISLMKASGKKVLAYLSIGETEDYRFYWASSWSTNPPVWLGPENPNWPGNYKVRYWDLDWQEIIKGYLDEIVLQGFDGIYLDIIDAYYYWSEENPERSSAEVDMIQFVVSLRAHLSEVHKREDFWVVPQNGEFVIDEDDTTSALREQYFEAITAIGVEDVFFQGSLDEDNPFNPDSERLEVLSEYQAAGKPILSIEYVNNPNLIEQYSQAAFERSFIPYTSVRALNILREGMVEP